MNPTQMDLMVATTLTERRREAPARPSTGAPTGARWRRRAGGRLVRLGAGLERAGRRVQGGRDLTPSPARA